MQRRLLREQDPRRGLHAVRGRHAPASSQRDGMQGVRLGQLLRGGEQRAAAVRGWALQQLHPPPCGQPVPAVCERRILPNPECRASNCSAGSYTSDATAHDKCTSCAAGTFQDAGGDDMRILPAWALLLGGRVSCVTVSRH